VKLETHRKKRLVEETTGHRTHRPQSHRGWKEATSAESFQSLAASPVRYKGARCDRGRQRRNRRCESPGLEGGATTVWVFGQTQQDQTGLNPQPTVARERRRFRELGRRVGKQE